MLEKKRSLDVLLGRIRETAWSLECSVSRTIDAAEGDPSVELDILESFEVIEATLVYHRRGSVLAVEGQREGRCEMPQAAGADTPSFSCGDGSTDDVLGAPPASIAERLLACGTRLNALALMYGVLERLARDGGLVELAGRAGVHRRDLIDLEHEIERSLRHGARLTGVINARSVIG